jgi:hypothetical protein
MVGEGRISTGAGLLDVSTAGNAVGSAFISGEEHAALKTVRQSNRRSILKAAKRATIGFIPECAAVIQAAIHLPLDQDA